MILDILVAILLLISALIAFLRGFIREVLTILGTVGALLAAYIGGPLLSPSVRGWMGAEDVENAPRFLDIVPYTLIADVLAYGGIFVVVVIILSLISHALAEGAKKIGLGAVDRTLGVIFGLVRGVILLGLLYLPIHLLVDDATKETWFNGSRTHIYLEYTAEWMSGFLPERQQAEEDLRETQGAVREQLQKMDLLGKDEEERRDIAEELLNTPAGDESNSQGYTDDFRRQMDKLFKQEEQGNETGGENE